jgi:hypothetical protein
MAALLPLHHAGKPYKHSLLPLAPYKSQILFGTFYYLILMHCVSTHTSPS